MFGTTSGTAVDRPRAGEEALVEQEGLDPRRLGAVVGVGGAEVVGARGEHSGILAPAEAAAGAHEVRRRVVALGDLGSEGLGGRHVLGVGQVAPEALAEPEHGVGLGGREQRVEDLEGGGHGPIL